MTPKKPFPEPPLLLVKAVCRASKDPSLKKEKFHRYLNIYEKEGLFCKRAKQLTPERKRYYDALRKKKMEKFIRQNKERIEQLRRITEAINCEEGKKQKGL
ncbi:hypothetical protein [Dysgonomonas sp. 520]|uniref:hypothetical protein n=1 Tax=Dysgonomonas sp. 520 TaxID=2302931 RepID=UPI0013D1B719|nr:hypothetical protein [Dysgonomonas sp. 520]